MADYSSAWRKYRQLRTQFFLLWAGFLPAMAILGGVSAQVFHHDRTLLSIAIAVWIPLFFSHGVPHPMVALSSLRRKVRAYWWEFGMVQRQAMCSLRTA
jgi:hypothetical protein